MPDKPKLPELFVQRLKDKFPVQAERVIQSIKEDQPKYSFRTNPLKPSDKLPKGQDIEWCEFGVRPLTRPSYVADPFYHAGLYYAQEASSMLIGQYIEPNQSELRVLDLCAAPGGKSTLIQSLIGEDCVLVSNEILGKRNFVLQENIIKWGGINNIITQNKSSDFVGLQGFFDIIILDAPCSGEGMFRKDDEAIVQWNDGLVNACSAIQNELMEKALELVADGGIIIYSTCTFENQENEETLRFAINQGDFELEKMEINHWKEWNLVPSEIDNQLVGYYALPGIFDGEGLFVSAFKVHKTHSKKYKAPNKNSYTILSKDFPAILKKENLKPSEIVCFKDNQYYLMNQLTLDTLAHLNKLIVRKSGVSIGQVLKNSIIPAQDLANYYRAKHLVNCIEVDLDTALRFLQKSDNLVFNEADNGWNCLIYEGYGLGWIKNLGNRTNNHYPSDWKIRKTIV